MLPTYRYTEFTSKSGNTEFIYIVHKKRKPLIEAITDKIQAIPERKRFLIGQKLCGVGLLVVGVVGCFIIPEDCGACVFASLMEILRIAFN